MLVGGGTINIAWQDSSIVLSISDLSSYQLFLVAGGQDDASQTVVATITAQGSFVNGNQAQGAVATTQGGSTANAYFFEMVSVDTNGG